MSPSKQRFYGKLFMRFAKVTQIVAAMFFKPDSSGNTFASWALRLRYRCKIGTSQGASKKIESNGGVALAKRYLQSFSALRLRSE